MLSTLIRQKMERDVDALMTAKVESFTGLIVAKNETHELFAEYSELNGFTFLHLTLLGSLNVHVNKGCKVCFETAQETIHIDSDTQEIFTDFSKKMMIGITRIERDVDDALKLILLNPTLRLICFTIGNHQLNLVPDVSVMTNIPYVKPHDNEPDFDAGIHYPIT